MRLIIGLGNPGVEYTNTRHNVGCLLVDRLQKSKLSVGMTAKKSEVFMNESGVFVKRLVDQYKLNLNDLYVAHDDLDIPLGSYKIQFGVGPKIHNGVASVEAELGTKDFWRIRIGVDDRDLGDRTPGVKYVLQDFSGEEKETLEAVLKKICKEINHLLQ